MLLTPAIHTPSSISALPTSGETPLRWQQLDEERAAAHPVRYNAMFPTGVSRLGQEPLTRRQNTGAIGIDRGRVAENFDPSRSATFSVHDSLRGFRGHSATLLVDMPRMFEDHTAKGAHEKYAVQRITAERTGAAHIPTSVALSLNELEFEASILLRCVERLAVLFSLCHPARLMRDAASGDARVFESNVDADEHKRASMLPGPVETARYTEHVLSWATATVEHNRRLHFQSFSNQKLIGSEAPPAKIEKTINSVCPEASLRRSGAVAKLVAALRCTVIRRFLIAFVCLRIGCYRVETSVGNRGVGTHVLASAQNLNVLLSRSVVAWAFAARRAQRAHWICIALCEKRNELLAQCNALIAWTTWMKMALKRRRFAFGTQVLVRAFEQPARRMMTEAWLTWVTLRAFDALQAFRGDAVQKTERVAIEADELQCALLAAQTEVLESEQRCGVQRRAEGQVAAEACTRRRGLLTNRMLNELREGDQGSQANNAADVWSPSAARSIAYTEGAEAEHCHAQQMQEAERLQVELNRRDSSFACHEIELHSELEQLRIEITHELHESEIKLLHAQKQTVHLQHELDKQEATSSEELCDYERRRAASEGEMLELKNDFERQSLATVRERQAFEAAAEQLGRRLSDVTTEMQHWHRAHADKSRNHEALEESQALMRTELQSQAGDVLATEQKMHTLQYELDEYCTSMQREKQHYRAELLVASSKLSAQKAAFTTHESELHGELEQLRIAIAEELTQNSGEAEVEVSHMEKQCEERHAAVIVAMECRERELQKANQELLSLKINLRQQILSALDRAAQSSLMHVAFAAWRSAAQEVLRVEARRLAAAVAMSVVFGAWARSAVKWKNSQRYCKFAILAGRHQEKSRRAAILGVVIAWRKFLRSRKLPLHKVQKTFRIAIAAWQQWLQVARLKSVHRRGAEVGLELFYYARSHVHCAQAFDIWRTVLTRHYEFSSPQCPGREECGAAACIALQFRLAALVHCSHALTIWKASLHFCKFFMPLSVDMLVRRIKNCLLNAFWRGWCEQIQSKCVFEVQMELIELAYGSCARGRYFPSYSHHAFFCWKVFTQASLQRHQHFEFGANAMANRKAQVIAKFAWMDWCWQHRVCKIARTHAHNKSHGRSIVLLAFCFDALHEWMTLAQGPEDSHDGQRVPYDDSDLELHLARLVHCSRAFVNWLTSVRVLGSFAFTCMEDRLGRIRRNILRRVWLTWYQRQSSKADLEAKLRIVDFIHDTCVQTEILRSSYVHVLFGWATVAQAAKLRRHRVELSTVAASRCRAQGLSRFVWREWHLHVMKFQNSHLKLRIASLLALSQASCKILLVIGFTAFRACFAFTRQTDSLSMKYLPPGVRGVENQFLVSRKSLCTGTFLLWRMAAKAFGIRRHCALQCAQKAGDRLTAMWSTVCWFRWCRCLETCKSHDAQLHLTAAAHAHCTIHVAMVAACFHGLISWLISVRAMQSIRAQHWLMEVDFRDGRSSSSVGSMKHCRHDHVVTACFHAHCERMLFSCFQVFVSWAVNTNRFRACRRLAIRCAKRTAASVVDAILKLCLLGWFRQCDYLKRVNASSRWFSRFRGFRQLKVALKVSWLQWCGQLFCRRLVHAKIRVAMHCTCVQEKRFLHACFVAFVARRTRSNMREIQSGVITRCVQEDRSKHVSWVRSWLAWRRQYQHEKRVSYLIRLVILMHGAKPYLNFMNTSCFCTFFAWASWARTRRVKRCASLQDVGAVWCSHAYAVMRLVICNWDMLLRNSRALNAQLQLIKLVRGTNDHSSPCYSIFTSWAWATACSKIRIASNGRGADALLLYALRAKLKAHWVEWQRLTRCRRMYNEVLLSACFEALVAWRRRAIMRKLPIRCLMRCIPKEPYILELFVRSWLGWCRQHHRNKNIAFQSSLVTIMHGMRSHVTVMRESSFCIFFFWAAWTRTFSTLQHLSATGENAMRRRHICLVLNVAFSNWHRLLRNTTMLNAKLRLLNLVSCTGLQSSSCCHMFASWAWVTRCLNTQIAFGERRADALVGHASKATRMAYWLEWQRLMRVKSWQVDKHPSRYIARVVGRSHMWTCVRTLWLCWRRCLVDSKVGRQVGRCLSYCERQRTHQQVFWQIWCRHVWYVGPVAVATQLNAQREKLLRCGAIRGRMAKMWRVWRSVSATARTQRQAAQSMGRTLIRIRRRRVASSWKNIRSRMHRARIQNCTLACAIMCIVKNNRGSLCACWSLWCTYVASGRARKNAELMQGRYQLQVWLLVLWRSWVDVCHGEQFDSWAETVQWHAHKRLSRCAALLAGFHRESLMEIIWRQWCGLAQHRRDLKIKAHLLALARHSWVHDHEVNLLRLIWLGFVCQTHVGAAQQNAASHMMCSVSHVETRLKLSAYQLWLRRTWFRRTMQEMQGLTLRRSDFAREKDLACALARWRDAFLRRRRRERIGLWIDHTGSSLAQGFEVFCFWYRWRCLGMKLREHRYTLYNLVWSSFVRYVRCSVNLRTQANVHATHNYLRQQKALKECALEMWLSVHLGLPTHALSNQSTICGRLTTMCSSTCRSVPWTCFVAWRAISIRSRTAKRYEAWISRDMSLGGSRALVSFVWTNWHVFFLQCRHQRFVLFSFVSTLRRAYVRHAWRRFSKQVRFAVLSLQHASLALVSSVTRGLEQASVRAEADAWATWLIWVASAGEHSTHSRKSSILERWLAAKRGGHSRSAYVLRLTYLAWLLSLGTWQGEQDAEAGAMACHTTLPRANPTPASSATFSKNAVPIAEQFKLKQRACAVHTLAVKKIYFAAMYRVFGSWRIWARCVYNRDRAIAVLRCRWALVDRSSQILVVVVQWKLWMTVVRRHLDAVGKIAAILLHVCSDSRRDALSMLSKYATAHSRLATKSWKMTKDEFEKSVACHARRKLVVNQFVSKSPRRDHSGNLSDSPNELASEGTAPPHLRKVLQRKSLVSKVKQMSASPTRNFGSSFAEAPSPLFSPHSAAVPRREAISALLASPDQPRSPAREQFTSRFPLESQACESRGLLRSQFAQMRSERAAALGTSAKAHHTNTLNASREMHLEQESGIWKAVKPDLWVACAEAEASPPPSNVSEPIEPAVRASGHIFDGLRNNFSIRALLITAVSAWRGAVRSVRPRHRRSDVAARR